jgi:hypothetical protein
VDLRQHRWRRQVHAGQLPLSSTLPIDLKSTGAAPRSSDRGVAFWGPALALLALCLLTVLAYLPGLKGPFLFDDPPNIVQPFSVWLEGRTDWREMVFGNGSGLLGRPLSMLTFLANAAFTGLDPAPFKATNLAIHLICGLLIYQLVSRLLVRDPRLGANARLGALAVAALWLLHPIQVSTVLYVVQRMAQLSTLFVLAGMLAYVIGRVALEAGRTRAGHIWLFLVVPALTAAGMLCKENGALTPLLCAVIELGYFQPATSISPRSRSVRLFFGLTLFAPVLLLVGWYSLQPHRLLGAYEGRLFSLPERLLSESRVLMDYMGSLLLPHGPRLGLYTDDFPVSRGILSPPTTLLSLIALSVLVGVALRFRARLPSFFTGIGLYLAGHAMESTIFPLELYFEHRNYLPSVGFFLALVGLVASAVPPLLQRSKTPEQTIRVLRFGLVALLLAISAATFARAGIWTSWQLLAEQGVRHHPQSMRAHLDYAHLLQVQGRYQEAFAVFEHMSRMDNATARHVGVIDTVALQCMVNGETSKDATARMAAIAGSRLELGELLAFENLGNYLHERDCRNLDKSDLAAVIGRVVDSAPQPATLTQLWRSRFVAARLYAAAGALPQAQEQAARAWMSGAADPAVGLFLADLYLHSGDLASARLVMADAQKRIARWDTRNQRNVVELEQRIKASKAPASLPGLQ